MAEVCPVCGSTEWDIDYDRTADGERRVDRCARCGWPPPGPVSVEEYRQMYENLGPFRAPNTGTRSDDA